MTARRASLREMVLEVRFHPEGRPAQVDLLNSDLDGSGEIVGPVVPDSTGPDDPPPPRPRRYAARWR